MYAIDIREGVGLKLNNDRRILVLGMNIIILCLCGQDVHIPKIRFDRDEISFLARRA